MDVLEWTVDDVGDWLNRLALPEEVQAAFKDKKVDGPTLLELGEEDVRAGLGVEDSIHRKKIKGHVEALKLRAAQAATALPATPVGRGMPNGVSPHGRMLPPRGLGGEEYPEGYPTPRDDGLYLRRTPSARSERLESGWATDSQAGGTRYSHLLSRTTATNVDTSFGWDSPSYSIKGSFARAPRATPRNYLGSPGPTTYNTSEQRARSPRACFGNSSRDTAEHFLRGKSSPGAGQYNPGELTSKGGARVKGGVISAAPRFRHMERPTSAHTPGPAHYHVKHCYRSNFR